MKSTALLFLFFHIAYVASEAQNRNFHFGISTDGNISLLKTNGENNTIFGFGPGTGLLLGYHVNNKFSFLFLPKILMNRLNELNSDTSVVFRTISFPVFVRYSVISNSSGAAFGIMAGYSHDLFLDVHAGAKGQKDYIASHFKKSGKYLSFGLFLENTTNDKIRGILGLIYHYGIADISKGISYGSVFNSGNDGLRMSYLQLTAGIYLF